MLFFLSPASLGTWITCELVYLDREGHLGQLGHTVIQPHPPRSRRPPRRLTRLDPPRPASRLMALTAGAVGVSLRSRAQSPIPRRARDSAPEGLGKRPGLPLAGSSTPDGPCEPGPARLRKTARVSNARRSCVDGCAREIGYFRFLRLRTCVGVVGASV